MHELIAQIVDRVSSLTDEQVVQMNAAFLPIDEIVEAHRVVDVDESLLQTGEESLLQMSQLDASVDPGVYSVARTAILGILSKGQVPDEVSARLIRVWTDIVEPLYAPAPEEVASTEAVEPVGEVQVEAPHAPTEEELADLGAPVEEVEAPATEVVEVPAGDSDGSTEVTTPSGETTETSDIEEGLV